MLVYIILAVAVRSQQAHLFSLLGEASNWLSAEAGCIQWMYYADKVVGVPSADGMKFVCLLNFCKSSR